MERCAPILFDGKNFREENAGATRQTAKDIVNSKHEASKGDGEMGTGAMGVMDQKFGSAAAAYSYLIFVLLYVPCISVMGAIARESSRGWMGFSILWGLNIAYSLATLFYQVASYSQHPTYSLVCILAVILFNIVVICSFRAATSRRSSLPAGWKRTQRC